MDGIGGWRVEDQPFDTPDGRASNLDVRHESAPDPDVAALLADGDPPPPPPALLVGAHYDTWRGTPGADDNASAVAALLHMLAALRDHPAARSGRLRFALYANEEPPYFRTRHMGSLHHAAGCRERGESVEMLCLESLGYYSDEPGGQQDPTADLSPDLVEAFAGGAVADAVRAGGLLGTVGDSLALEADADSAGLLARLRAGYLGADRAPDADPALAAQPRVRLASAALPREFCSGLSDHWSYWCHGYPAVMATDTALLRNPHYHEPTDLPGTLDYPRFASVVARLTAAVAHAAATVPAGG